MHPSDSRPPCLVLIESNTSGTGPLFVRCAGRMGFRPVVLAADPARWQSLRDEGAEVVSADTRSEAALLEVCRGLDADASVAGVTSSSDYFIGAAAAVARDLGLPGPSPDAIRACRDKEVQRTLLMRGGVGIPRWAPAESVGEALAACERLGFPVVLKPVGGSGSVGVRLCTNGNEVAAHAEKVLSVIHNERGLPVRRAILVEELAVGPEYSVETFHGEVVGIAAKLVTPPPWFVEVGHDYPGSPGEVEAEALRWTARRALEVLKLNWGAAHVELRLTPTGPRIIEVNPRLAGGYIPELVRRASGVDLITATVAAAVGRRAVLRPTRRRFASIRFLLPPGPGALLGVEGVEHVRRMPRVCEVRQYREPGAGVTRAGDFRDRIGHVIATGGSAREARAAAERAHAMLHVQVQRAEPVGAEAS